MYKTYKNIYKNYKKHIKTNIKHIKTVWTLFVWTLPVWTLFVWTLSVCALGPILSVSCLSGRPLKTTKNHSAVLTGSPG